MLIQKVGKGVISTPFSGKLWPGRGAPNDNSPGRLRVLISANKCGYHRVPVKALILDL